MMSISDFSEMCRLSPQTLRFYHSEGLLVPSDVDERTGYRAYTFDQVEQAMLIAVLRDAGMSVKLVRRALDEPDLAAALLHEHTEQVGRERQVQDEAISDARELLGSRPEPRLRHVPEMTVVSKPVPDPLAEHDDVDHAWKRADAVLAAATREVVAAVESCGGAVVGTPWRAQSIGAEEQPHWLVMVPVTVDEAAVAALPGDVEVRTFAARTELSIFIPGRSSMAKYATAISRLYTHPLGDAILDAAHIRQLPHDGGVETAAAVREPGELDERTGGAVGVG